MPQPTMTEACAACGAVVPYGDAVHVTVHTKSDAGVVDAFVCRECYEGELADVVE